MTDRPAGRERSPASPSVILRGNTSHGERVVLARAVKISQDENSGRSLLDPDLLALAARQARREEPVDIALVTVDAHHSLLLPLPPGLILAAVVSEWETDPRFALPGDLTVVSGVGGARDAIPEGEWLIVDPQRQRITVGPDASAIARLQHRLRPRYRLGAQSQPARTLAGVEVLVWARIFTEADLAEALAAGADGFVVDGPGDFLPWDTENGNAEEDFARLLPIAEAAGGGDVALLSALDAVDAAALVRLAALCRLRLLLPPEALTLSLPELRAELSAIADDQMDAGRLAAVPRLSALLSTPPDPSDDAEALYGFEEAALLPFSDEEVAELSLPALLTVPPLFAFLRGSDEEAETLRLLSRVIDSGVRGLVLPPGLIAQAKETIQLQ